MAGERSGRWNGWGLERMVDLAGGADGKSPRPAAPSTHRTMHRRAAGRWPAVPSAAPTGRARIRHPAPPQCDAGLQPIGITKSNMLGGARRLVTAAQPLSAGPSMPAHPLPRPSTSRSPPLRGRPRQSPGRTEDAACCQGRNEKMRPSRPLLLTHHCFPIASPAAGAAAAGKASAQP